MFIKVVSLILSLYCFQSPSGLRSITFWSAPALGNSHLKAVQDYFWFKRLVIQIVSLLFFLSNRLYSIYRVFIPILEYEIDFLSVSFLPRFDHDYFNALLSERQNHCSGHYHISVQQRVGGVLVQNPHNFSFITSSISVILFKAVCTTQCMRFLLSNSEETKPFQSSKLIREKSRYMYLKYEHTIIRPVYNNIIKCIALHVKFTTIWF